MPKLNGPLFSSLMWIKFSLHPGKSHIFHTNLFSSSLGILRCFHMRCPILYTRLQCVLGLTLVCYLLDMSRGPSLLFWEYGRITHSGYTADGEEYQSNCRLNGLPYLTEWSRRVGSLYQDKNEIPELSFDRKLEPQPQMEDIFWSPCFKQRNHQPALLVHKHDSHSQTQLTSQEHRNAQCLLLYRSTPFGERDLMWFLM